MKKTLLVLLCGMMASCSNSSSSDTDEKKELDAVTYAKENGIIGGWDLGGRIVRIYEGKYRTKNGEVKNGLLVYPTTNMADIAYPVKVLVGDTIRFEIIDQNSNLMADVVEKKIYFHNKHLQYLSEKMEKM
jgi:hypothetical protein